VANHGCAEEEDAVPVQDDDMFDTVIDHILSLLGHTQTSSSVRKA